MKTLYLQCNMGIAGDMMAAALYELLEDQEDFLAVANQLLPQVSVTAEPAEKQGIRGTHLAVRVNGSEEEQGIADHHHSEHHHHHASLSHIRSILSGLPVSQHVKEQAAQVYDFLAHAEAKAHGCPVDQIHFHEVGTMDAVMDVAAVCLLLYELAPDKITASPVHVGCGEVRCAHGVLPVPAPATAYLLRGIPSYGGAVRGELCTPTGAALLRYFVEEYGEQPVMRTEKIGYGMGKKDFPRANCIRAMLGETAEAGDRVLELRCNLDDMTGEDLGYCTEQLFQAGARDVFTTAIGMKKGRPGVLLTVICDPEHRDRMLQVLFRETTTLGVRETSCSRYILRRTEETVSTSFGEIRVKTSEGFGVKRKKAEYDDLKKIAEQSGRSLRDVREAVEKELQ